MTTPYRLRYAVLTFGCRVNQADSFALERQLRAAGGQAAPAEAPADPPAEPQ